MSRLQTLQDIVALVAERGDRPAIVAMRKDHVETWSCRGLSERARQLASGFLQGGLAPKDQAVLFSPSRPELIGVCLGLIMAGAVPVPLDTQMTDDDLHAVLQDCEAKWIFTTTGLVRRLEELGVADKLKIVLLDADSHDPASWRHYLVASESPLPKAEPDDRAVIFYTSGTSGPPKGVPLTHRNVVSNVQSVLDMKLLTADDRVLLPLPLHHVYPFNLALFVPLSTGSAIVLPLSLTGPQILRALQEGKTTALVCVPRLMGALDTAIAARITQMGRVAAAIFRGMMRVSIAARRRFGLRLGRVLFAPLHRRFAPYLRLITCGGAALDPQLAWRMEGLGWAVATGYGLTETSPLLTFTLSEDRRPEATGRVVPGVELRITKLEDGVNHGEVQARGPNVFAGYHHLPERTREVFTEDGFFRTGDLGYFDAEGFLYLVGRASSMIVLAGGENVRPEHVEEALERGAHIHEAAVLEHDNRLVALIVPDPEALRKQTSEAELEEAIRREVEEQNRRLPTHHRIADYALVRDPLPRTRLGKIRRHLLRQRYDEARSHKGGEPQACGPISMDRMAPEHRQLLEDPTARKVWDILCQRFHDVRLAPDSNVQLDLGIDSMEWLNLTLEIRQQTGADLDQDAIAKVETVADLLQQSVDAGQGGTAPEDVLEMLKRPEELLTPEDRHWLTPRNAFQRGFGAVLMGINRRVLMGGFHHVHAHGLERIPRSGPVLFVPNHRSMLDPPALGAVMPPEVWAQTYWAAWTGIMFRDPMMRLGSRSLHVVPVASVGGTISSLAFGVTALRRGHNLVWFPEGGRALDGQMRRFQVGIGLVLLSQPVPVVPVWIQDTGTRLPSEIGNFQRRSLEVVFGDPLDPQQLLSEGNGDAPEQRIANALARHVQALGDAFQRSTG